MGDFEQQQLWDDEAIVAQVRFSEFYGWEYVVRHRDGTAWTLVSSGTASTTQSALALVAEELLDLAHGWEF